MIIDDMSNNQDTLLNSGRHKYKQGRSLIKCQTIRTWYVKSMKEHEGGVVYNSGIHKIKH